MSSKFIFIAIISSLMVQAHSNLISVLQVFRHGQRTPVSYYKNDPWSDQSYWPVEPGQLTPTGENQHYSLGNFTRQRYGEWLGKYDKDTFRIQTTDVDRTHMSAQCNLAGLFPPEGTQIWNPDILWQPIPVHIADTAVWTISTNCAAYSEELSRVLAEEKYFSDVNAEYQSVYDYLTLNSGTNVSSVTEANGIRDTLLIEDEFGYALPAWTKSVYPTPLDFLGGYAFQIYAYNKKLQRLSTGVFIDTLINYFDDMKNSTTTPKYQIYSGHDSNIAAILSTLGIVEPYAPYFASTIYFELRELLGVYFVNVYHKNKDTFEKLTVKGCLVFDCPLFEFKKLMKDVRLDVATWKSECAQTTNYPVSRTVQNLFLHQDPNGPGHKVGT